MLAISLLFACAPQPGMVTGWVLDTQEQPITGAVVRLKASNLAVETDADGYFQLLDIPANQPLFVTAWSPGYYINGLDAVQPGSMDLRIVLQAHHDSDNPDYAWLPSTRLSGEGEAQGCAECHSREGSDLPFTLPVDEWLLDAHSQSAVNPRFLTMYSGTDVEGNRSPQTRYNYSRDYGRFPLRPDPNQPYFGPGYKLDFPNTAGNCAACHTPAAAIDAAYGVNPTSVSGVAREGIPCDFCHKVWDVILDPATGLPFANMPGVLSFEFRRPPEGHQFFAGPFDDVAPGEDTFTPIQRESQFCAPCHFGIFWDTLIYNSFGEWLESPYSDAESGQTCQDCHMPPLGATHFALPDQGGVARDPQTIFSHLMPGASSPDLLQASVSMDVSAARTADQLSVSVTIVNDKTGHHVPTDSPLRHMILLVQAEGAHGAALPQVSGQTIPEYAGVGDPNLGYYAGLPGKVFAKILMELWTEISPSGAYWNPTVIVSDNRLAAFEADTSSYVFSIPQDDGDAEASVTATLLFR
ncbi:MAG: carboxypeptidase regulatory-like domain-containing protein, partial [Anaerolineales bacterium]|nr:carboxypeptidase regulatory-like domain-containing protein [Anaerolineales bacterium]